MILLSDKGLLVEMKWMLECLDKDKVSYTVSLSIGADKRPFVRISNGRVSLTIKRVARQLVYSIRDEDAVKYARREGFSEDQIKEQIKCCYMVDREKAEIMITNPLFLAQCKADAIKENLANNSKETT